MRIAFVALLRGINVGGHTLVPMAGLRDLATDLGFDNPRTILQSGNLVFQSKERATAPIERVFEDALEKRLGVRADVLVRTAQEWQGVIAQNPFPNEAAGDPSHLLVTCLKGAPDGAAVKALQAAITGRERVHAVGRELYAVYPDGVGRSRLTNAVIEKTLAMRGTARNWNTVLKLGALCRETKA